VNSIAANAVVASVPVAPCTGCTEVLSFGGVSRLIDRV